MELFSVFYQLAGGIFFYIYILLFAFKKGKFAKANPLFLFPSLNKKIDFFINYLKNISIFPSWALFIGLNEQFFTDLVVKATTTTGKEYEWIVGRDLRVGALDLKNKFFILSITSHYSSFKRSVDLIIKKSVKVFLSRKNEELESIKIYRLDFKFPMGEKGKNFEYQQFIKNEGVEKFPVFMWKKYKKQNKTAYDIV